MPAYSTALFWESPAIDTMPKSMVTFNGLSAVKAEETDYDSFDSHQGNSAPGDMSTADEENKAKLSGGGAHQAWAGSWQYDETFKVYNSGTAGTYRLWYHGTALDGSNMSPLTLNVNGSSVAMTKVTENESITGAGKTFVCAWYTAEITLTAGENTINYYNANTIYNSATAGCHVLLDCFVLAPSNYDWISPTISTMPELTKFKVTNFNITGTASAGNTVSHGHAPSGISRRQYERTVDVPIYSYMLCYMSWGRKQSQEYL